MRVSRIQAEENRQKVINVASRLFRERGFDGIGLKDLMKGAGMTQGAFYKQFESKDDLAAQASKRALETASRRWSGAASANPEEALRSVIGFYLSLGHRDELTDGCPIVALGSDAARQGPEVKAAFEDGVRSHLDVLSELLAANGSDEAKAKAMAALATMVGAVTLSRVVNDAGLAKDILDAAARQILADNLGGPGSANGG